MEAGEYNPIQQTWTLFGKALQIRSRENSDSLSSFAAARLATTVQAVGSHTHKTRHVGGNE
jgi:hypothetical protein